ncbi:hypothetical protein XF36_12885 [Pseudonocardia sp. HH130629-09]|nr:hypothetical protein XF36_12885 [Pseudonocardia sp. HH130629-09]
MPARVPTATTGAAAKISRQPSSSTAVDLSTTGLGGVPMRASISSVVLRVCMSSTLGWRSCGR